MGYTTVFSEKKTGYSRSLNKKFGRKTYTNKERGIIKQCLTYNSRQIPRDFH